MDGMENSKMGSRRKELTAPCKGCKERFQGCHDGCQGYKEFQAAVAEKNKYMKRSRWDCYDPLAPKRRRDL